MTTMAAQIEWITTQEAAKIIGCHVSSVRRLCADGTLHAKPFGTVWQVDRKSAEKFAATEQLTGRPRGS